jgi:2,4-dienoyl-CoA reductase (NADPH2)
VKDPLFEPIIINQLELKIEEIPADTVVLAVGAASYNPLQEFVDKKRIQYKVIGDATRAALAFDAVHQGFEAGREIE